MSNILLITKDHIKNDELALSLYETFNMMPSCYIVTYNTYLNIIDKSSNKNNDGSENKSGIFISNTNHPNDINIANNLANKWVEDNYKEFEISDDSSFEIIENKKYEEYKLNYYTAYYNNQSKSFNYDIGTKDNESLSKYQAEEWVRSLGGTVSSDTVKSTLKSFYKHSFIINYKISEYSNTKSGSSQLTSITEFIPKDNDDSSLNKFLKEINSIKVGEVTIDRPDENSINFNESKMSEKIAKIIVDYYSKNVSVIPGTSVSGTVPGGTFSGIISVNSKPIMLPGLDSLLSAKTDIIQNSVQELIDTAKDTANSATDTVSSGIKSLKDLAKENIEQAKSMLSGLMESLTNLLKPIKELPNSIKKLIEG